LDPVCRDALQSQMILVTTHVLRLGQRVTAGDLEVRAEVEALAALVENPTER
jgi:hypothetical protein